MPKAITHTTPFREVKQTMRDNSILATRLLEEWKRNDVVFTTDAKVLLKNIEGRVDTVHSRVDEGLNYERLLERVAKDRDRVKKLAESYIAAVKELHIQEEARLVDLLTYPHPCASKKR